MLAIPLVDVQRHWMDWGCPGYGHKARKKKPLAMRIVCEHLGVDWAPRIWPTGRKLLLLGIVYFCHSGGNEEKWRV